MVRWSIGHFLVANDASDDQLCWVRLGQDGEADDDWGGCCKNLGPCKARARHELVMIALISLESESRNPGLSLRTTTPKKSEIGDQASSIIHCVSTMNHLLAIQ